MASFPAYHNTQPLPVPSLPHILYIPKGPTSVKPHTPKQTYYCQCPSWTRILLKLDPLKPPIESKSLLYLQLFLLERFRVSQPPNVHTHMSIVTNTDCARYADFLRLKGAIEYVAAARLVRPFLEQRIRQRRDVKTMRIKRSGL